MTAPTDVRPLADRLRHLPMPLAVSGVLLIAVTGAGAVVDGADGALGGAIGVLLVAGGYALSSLTVAWADWISPRLVFTVGLASYLFKVSLFGVALFGLLRRDWPGERMMAVSMIAAIVAWVGAQTWWTARDRPPVPAVPAEPS